MQTKILVVEDNADCREMLRLVLGQEGYTVLLAENGHCGLAQAIHHRPDLVVTDLQMPRLSGIEMIGQLRTQPGFERLPILVLTATSDLRDDATAVGANYVLIKPSPLPILLEHITRLLNSANQHEDWAANHSAGLETLSQSKLL